MLNKYEYITKELGTENIVPVPRYKPVDNYIFYTFLEMISNFPSKKKFLAITSSPFCPPSSADLYHRFYPKTEFYGIFLKAAKARFMGCS